MDEKILLVPDEPKKAAGLSEILRGEGWTVEIARDGREGLNRALREPFDLIILDLMQTLRIGVNVCRDLRQNGLSMPILMLIPDCQAEDRILGLKAGADDCVGRPYAMLEVLARVESLLRRARGAPWGWGSIHYLGAIRVDVRRTQVWKRGKLVALSAREFQLLRYFVEHRGATLSRQELLREVWDFDPKTSTRTVDVHVAALRQKLEEHPKRPLMFVTIQGLGYKLDSGSTPVRIGE